MSGGMVMEFTEHDLQMEYLRGLEDGKEEGLSEGYDEGYDQGYHDGYEAGQY
jgi:flagellar biosynthesis/type III secretory pathway protein FliH